MKNVFRIQMGRREREFKRSDFRLRENLVGGERAYKVKRREGDLTGTDNQGFKPVVESTPTPFLQKWPKRMNQVNRLKKQYEKIVPYRRASSV